VFRDSTLLGREDGLSGIPRPVLSVGVVAVDLAHGNNYYWFVLVACLLLGLFLWWVAHSRIGRVLRGVRQDADRAAFLGIDVYAWRFRAFTIAGAVAALAGALQAPWAQIVTPQVAHCYKSTLPVLDTLLGGAGSFCGPLIGAAAFSFIAYGTRQLAGLSELIVGTVLLAVVLLAPGRNRRAARPRRRRRASPPRSHRRDHPSGPGGLVTTLLEARGLVKAYGGISVLKGVDLTIEDGEIFAVIGPNGAGKTTLFKVLTGEVPLNGGAVYYEGEEATALPAHRRVRLGFGRTFQVSRVFAEMSVLEKMVVAIECRRRNAGERVGSILAWRPARGVEAEARERLAEVALATRSGLAAGTLSYGDRKRLELALALALRPRVLMLDEPTAGMSPNDRAEAVELIRRVRDRHRITLLLTEHDMSVVSGWPAGSWC
jgi:branched-chain amino acid transport system ATP-binding protein